MLTVLFKFPTVSLAKIVIVRFPSVIIDVLTLTFQVPLELLAVRLNGFIAPPAETLLNWKITVSILSKLSLTVALKAFVPVKLALAAGEVILTEGAVLSTVNEMLTVLFTFPTESLA